MIVRTFRHLVTVFIVSSCLMAPFVAWAQSTSEFNALLNRWVEARCHMGACTRFSINSAEFKGTSMLGALFLVRTQNRYEVYDKGDYTKKPVEVEQSSGIEYVFCSKLSPLIISQQDGRWTAQFLKPGRSDAEFGFNVSGYKLYYAACHNTSRYVDEQLANRLGYSFSDGELPDNVTLRAPTDVLTWGESSPQISAFFQQNTASRYAQASSEQLPFSVSTSYQYANNGSALGWVITLQSREDSITIQKISPNRGNCQTNSFHELEIGAVNRLTNMRIGVLPVVLRFGASWSSIAYQCKPIEVDIVTNRGNFRVPISYPRQR